MEKSKLIKNKRITKTVFYTLLISAICILGKAPQTNSYFIKSEKNLVLSSNKIEMYKVNPLEVNNREVTINNSTANFKLTLKRTDTEQVAKKYRIRCNDTIISDSVTIVTTAIIPVTCSTDSSDNSVLRVKVYELINDEEFLCGEKNITYETETEYAKLLTFMQNSYNWNEGENITAAAYLAFNNINTDDDILPNLKHIGVTKNPEYTKDINFDGYIKTYQYYQTLTNTTKKMYFTFDKTNDNESVLESAFTSYLDKYIYPDNTYTSSKIKYYISEYLKNENSKFQDIFAENPSLTIPGITYSSESPYEVLTIDENINEIINNNSTEINSYEDKITELKTTNENAYNYLSNLPISKNNPIYKSLINESIIEPNYYVYNENSNLSILVIDKSKNITIQSLTEENLNIILNNGSFDLIVYASNQDSDLFTNANTFLTSLGINPSVPISEEGYTMITYKVTSVSQNEENNADLITSPIEEVASPETPTSSDKETEVDEGTKDETEGKDPVTPPTEEDKKDEGEESTDNNGDGEGTTEENNPDNPSLNDKEQTTDSKTPTDKDEGTTPTPSEDNNTSDSSQNDLGGNSNETTSLDNAPVESAPEVPASSNSTVDSTPTTANGIPTSSTINNLN